MTRNGRACSALIAFAMAVAGCGSNEPGAPSASAVAPAPSPAPSPVDSVAVEEELSTRPVELLKLTMAGAVENREPKEPLTAAKPGTRVYVHLVVRNRSGHERKIHVVFKVNGETRTEVDLTVGNAWSWRTWAYNTLTAHDTSGKLTVDVTDDEGHPVGDAELPIR